MSFSGQCYSHLTNYLSNLKAVELTGARETEVVATTIVLKGPFFCELLFSYAVNFPLAKQLNVIVFILCSSLCVDFTWKDGPDNYIQSINQ